LRSLTETDRALQDLVLTTPAANTCRAPVAKWLAHLRSLPAADKLSPAEASQMKSELEQAYMDFENLVAHL